jgi:hypothetical protein
LLTTYGHCTERTHSYKKDCEKNFMGNDPGALDYVTSRQRGEEMRCARLHLDVPVMFSSRALSTITDVLYLLVILITAGFFTISCVVLLSQAVRTSPDRSWENNFNALIIGASYAIVVSLTQHYHGQT